MELSRREERNNHHPLFYIDDETLELEVYSDKGVKIPLSLDKEIEFLLQRANNANDLITKALNKRQKEKESKEESINWESFVFSEPDLENQFPFFDDQDNDYFGI